MKKKLLMISAIICFSIAITACGNDKQTAPANEQGEEMTYDESIANSLDPDNVLNQN